jgi:hypothetical protein
MPARHHFRIHLLWDPLLPPVLPDWADMLLIDDRETVRELRSQILNGTRLGPRNQDNNACVDFEQDHAHIAILYYNPVYETCFAISS